MKEDLPRVNTAATLFQEYCYQYRDQFSAGILCCGYDEVDGGQVYSIPLGGMKIRQPVSIGGSGSTWIYGLVDQQYKKGMNKQECIDFVKCALQLQWIVMPHQVVAFVSPLSPRMEL